MARWLLSIALALGPGGMAAAQDQVRTVPVHFPAGATGTVLEGSIHGYDTISYTIGAEAGQRMQIALTSSGTSIYFNLYEPGRGPGDQALAVSGMAGTETVPEINRVSAVLPASGTYTVNVYLFRNAACDGRSAAFSIDISVSALENPAAPVQGDFADGMAGGPDVWQAQTSGGPLNLRGSPSAAAGLMTQVANGTQLRNLGCRMNEGRRWCHVATLADPGSEGWAAGEYLVEGAAPLHEMPGGDALVAGTDFHATGQIACTRGGGAPMAECQFGVRREGPQNGTITVFWPDGGSRVIGYENDAPAWYDESQADGGAVMQVQQDADMFTVTIGPQRFEIVEAIMTSG